MGPQEGIFGRLLGLFGARPDPTRHWAQTDDPLPAFDLTTGTVGGIGFGDGIEQAEFLGRPDRIENPGWTRLHYDGRGFELYFEMNQLAKLRCLIAPPSGKASEAGQGFSRPRLSGGLELTPETTVAQVRQWFGRPESDDESPGSRILTYPRGRYFMDFEFDPSTERLLEWSATIDD